jgi:hypothetical protein
MKSYKPEELFDKTGRLTPGLAELPPGRDDPALDQVAVPRLPGKDERIRNHQHLMRPAMMSNSALSPFPSRAIWDVRGHRLAQRRSRRRRPPWGC